MEEKEITNEDVKKEYEELSGTAEATKESSTEEKEVSAPSPEDVKSVTEEVETQEVYPKTIPYDRFKEVNDRKTELEELAEQFKDHIVKDPITGKLTIKTPEKVEQEPEDEGLKLTEEEQLALDSTQMSVIEKLFNVWQQKKAKEERVQQVYRQETDSWWNKTTEDYPELKAKNFKDTPLYQRAVKILREQHIVWSPDKKTFYIPPNAQYLSTVQAEKELAREKVKTIQAKVEEKKNSKTNVFVEKKSSVGQAKKKVEEKEFETLSYSEQENALREQWQEVHPEE